ncbi:MAG: FkbM family methyltransferase [Phycisphaerales bacterium]|nr:FkbM family methyltransferase [Phycisphaerales bacterium]
MPVSATSPEAQIVLKHFELLGHSGRFLEIGAHDGRTTSNTLRLAEIGWSGVCFEPDERTFPKLKQEHKDRPHVICKQAAVTENTDGHVTFYPTDSTVAATTLKSFAGDCRTEISVPAMSVAMLLRTFGDNYDFVTIDTEGTSYELFKAMPWDRLKNVSLVCVEHDGHRGKQYDRSREIVEHARKYGFVELCRTPVDVFLHRPGESMPAPGPNPATEHVPLCNLAGPPNIYVACHKSRRPVITNYLAGLPHEVLYSPAHDLPKDWNPTQKKFVYPLATRHPPYAVFGSSLTGHYRAYKAHQYACEAALKSWPGWAMSG